MWDFTLAVDDLKADENGVPTVTEAEVNAPIDLVGDSEIVFYNQMEGPNGIATFIPSVDCGSTKVHKIDFDLSKSSGGITKYVINI